MTLDRIEAVKNNVALMTEACNNLGFDFEMNTFKSAVLAEGVIKGLTIQTTVSETGLATWSLGDIDFTSPEACATYLARALAIIEAKNTLIAKGIEGVRHYLALGVIRFDGCNASISVSKVENENRHTFYVRDTHCETLDEALIILQERHNLELNTNKYDDFMQRAKGVMESVEGEWHDHVFVSEDDTTLSVYSDELLVVRLGSFRIETYSLLLARCLINNGSGLAAISKDETQLKPYAEAIELFYRGYGNWQAVLEVAYKVVEQVDSIKMLNNTGSVVTMHDKDSNVLCLSKKDCTYLQSLNTMSKEEQDKEMNELDEFVKTLKK